MAYKNIQLDSVNLIVGLEGCNALNDMWKLLDKISKICRSNHKYFVITEEI